MGVFGFCFGWEAVSTENGNGFRVRKIFFSFVPLLFSFSGVEAFFCIFVVGKNSVPGGDVEKCLTAPNSRKWSFQFPCCCC